MPEKKSSIKWFLTELPHLQENNLLTAETAENLQMFYQERLNALPSPVNYFLTVFSILGGVLIAGGVIMLLNYNWDMFGKTTRLGIAVFPLILAALFSLYTLIAGRSQLWKECSAIFTAGSAATLIALVSQIYHINSDFGWYMVLVLALALPLIYIFNSVGLATLYTLGLFFTLIDGEVSVVSRGILLGGIMPYVFYHLEFQAGQYKKWMRWLVITLALYGAWGCADEYYLPFMLVALVAAFLLAGWNLYEKFLPLRHNPWIFGAYFLLLLILGIGSSNPQFWVLDQVPAVPELTTYWIFTGVVLGSFAIQLFRRKLDAKRVMLLALLALAASPFVGAQPEVLECLANIYMGVFAVVFLFKGVKRKQLLTFNGGLLMGVLLIACRFFDHDIGLLARGSGFIALGIIFIVANWRFARTLKKEATL